MSINKAPTNSVSMKIDRKNNSINIEWDRNSKNIESIIKNLDLFNIKATPEIIRQIKNIPNSNKKKIKTDTIYI